MTRPARVHIDLKALRNNLSIARQLAGKTKLMAVIKADAYGHGMFEVAQALTDADAFAVASIGEGVQLRSSGITQPILVLQGAHHPPQLKQAVASELMLCIHQSGQIEDLQKYQGRWPKVWLKLDTGMGRLGFSPADLDTLLNTLGENCESIMMHFANADVPDDARNAAQLLAFHPAMGRSGYTLSAANSAALMLMPNARLDWVRPGIMLYGVSPFVSTQTFVAKLQPVMTLTAPLIAINNHQRGDQIGYAGSYTCPKPMPVGVVAIGYGDGYPRHAATGTPMLVNGIECPLIGRVSMDMLTVDLRNCSDVELGAEITLWGKGLAVERVAEKAGTIGYELLCSVGAHCGRVY
ncbi:MAG: alanine racemase [Thiothrix sp.]|nr:MAG: alanine racemase [Thiothrix sp.]